MTWSRSRVEEFMATAGDAVAGVYLAAGSEPGPEWAWLPGAVAESPAGAFYLRERSALTALVPPFAPAPPFEPWQECLAQTLARPRKVGVLLLRLGHYALGVVDNDVVLVAKAGARYVHGRHRAGGQSQRRWERNREQWIEVLFDRVCEAWRVSCSPFERQLEHFATGGDRIVLSRFIKHCPEIGRLQDVVLPRRVPVERPLARSIEEARISIWSSTVYRLTASD